MEFAYTLYLEGMCDCGRPKFECRNDANVGLYEVAEVTCYAQAAVEEHTGKDGFKADPGQRFYAREIDEELVTRRTFGLGEMSDDVASANNGEADSEH